MNRPLTSGDFDPLSAPGSQSGTRTVTGASFKAGQFVRATIDNTAFFKNRPKSEGDADKLLPRGTSMKVISTSDTFVKVELDSGEIGFVPSIMLEDPNAVPGAPVTNPGEIQVYPPSGYTQPLPPLDPTGVPPDGAIPTVIDPEAPAVNTPVPPVTPPNETFPTPVEPKIGPAPLPPNGEEKPAEATPKLEQ
ncbi:MAG: hypothetical protein H8M99_01695 [Gloeobacteraceae cyanobacterium ES-bin-144]|nr:hypothetical protein [Verrucomicrobiales bacterium]